jgi:hypothetical protein
MCDRQVSGTVHVCLWAHMERQGVCVCVCVCTSVAALGVDRAPVELVAWCLRIAEPPDF